MNSFKNFIDEMSKIERIRIVVNELNDDWGNNVPITILFSGIGIFVVNYFDKLSDLDKGYIFDRIEYGLNSGDDSLKTAIATGFLEALYSRSSENKVLWGRIEAHLGKKSREYIVAWLNWHR